MTKITRTSIQPALDTYNERYFNPAYMDLRNHVAEFTICDDEHNLLMNLIIDACLEQCGMHLYDGSRALVLECMKAIGKHELRAHADHYIGRFADEPEDLPF